MRTPHEIYLIALSLPVLLLGACGDDDGSPGHDAGPGQDAGPGHDAAAPPDGAVGPDAAPADAGCGDSLATAVRVSTVAIDTAWSSLALTAQAGAGSVVAWIGADGIHVTTLDADDARVGNDRVLEGSQVFGVAASGSDVALLVSRPPDLMTFVRLDAQGAVLTSVDLVGGGDHAVEGVEWFGEFASTGRLVALEDGTFAAYHALHRRWPDGIGHQGDTLRLLDSAGQPLGGWGWGCSHSMDQRLATGPAGLVPICIADCYPGKGIYFNHDQAQITPDEAANCAGGYTTRLGGLVAVQGGFFLVYQDAAGQAHLGHHDTGGQPLADRTLAVAGDSRLAAYGDGLLLASSGPGGATLQELDAAGADLGLPADVAVSLPDADLEGRDDGSVAWATAAGATLTVVRVLPLCP
jgi:hypothetical protein